MLDYEWGNPSNIMLTGNEDSSAAASDQTHRQIFDHYASQAMLSENYLNGSGNGLAINMNNLLYLQKTRIKSKKKMNLNTSSEVETRTKLDDRCNFDKKGLFDLDHPLVNRIAECSVKAAGIGAAQAFLTSRLQHRPISPHDTMNNQPTLYSTSESNRRATFSDLPNHFLRSAEPHPRP